MSDPLGAQPTDRKIKAGHLTLNYERKILCQKELNLEKNQKEKDKDKKRRISATYFLLYMVRD